jgi:putative intracellular protease/amidase
MESNTRRALRFVGHFLQMMVAMVIGMLVLDPVWRLVLPDAAERVDVLALVAATDMSIGMAVWMRLRGHGWPSILEMVAAMYVPFLVLLVPYWAGGISGPAVMTGGHALMVVAMVAVMLRRNAEYTHPHRAQRSGAARPVPLWAGGARPHPVRLRHWHRVVGRVLLRAGVVTVAVVVPPVAVGAVTAFTYLDTIYEPPADVGVPVSVAAPAHDPAKPTAVVLVGNGGANVADALGPYETFAATGAYNLYTVAPERQRVTLTGGLDLVPDLGFAELDQRLGGRAPDVITVPAMPDATADSSRPMRTWLARQADAGALVLSVCQGADVVAAAGILDGRDATSHWFRIDGLDEKYPDVRWHRATRYVDDGNVITTGGVLSGIDGTLRVIERMHGTGVAAAAAAAVGWTHYSPGTPGPLPASTFGPRDMITGVNLSFRPKQDIGVLVTDGVGEIELASVFITYSDVSYVARTVALGRDGTAPVRSRHGLVFVPRAAVFDASGLDRLIVPGADAARRPDPALDRLDPQYVHSGPGFAFVPVLRDMARSVDVPTARWRAKTLEYPVDELDLTGPGWPWGVTLLPLLYSLIGLAVVGAGWFALRLSLRSRRFARPAVTPAAGSDSMAGEPAADRAPEMAGR